MIKISTEQRRGMLRALWKERQFLRVMEAVNGLEGMIAENAEAYDANGCVRTFDALWLSGFCHAAFHGKPDNESVDFSEKVAAVNEIFAVSSKPLIIDMDTGGEPEHFCRHVAALERLGVSAVVIEDKTGIKRNSMYGCEQPQRLECAETFADKLRRAKSGLCTEDFMIFARTEALIAGESTDMAMERAKKYVEAGAGAIVIHSICADGSDVFRFAADFKACFAEVPLVFIPTAYNRFTAAELHQRGADMVIYANQLMRSAYLAMEKTAASILRDDGSRYADAHYCAPVRTILDLIDGE